MKIFASFNLFKIVLTISQIMEQYTIKERAQIVAIYVQNSFSIVKTQRAVRELNKSRSAPSKNTIKHLYRKFSTTGSLENAPRPNRERLVRSNQNIERVRATLEKDPTISTRRLSAQLNLSRRTLQRILHEDLNLFPYKVKIESNKKQSEDRTGIPNISKEKPDESQRDERSNESSKELLSRIFGPRPPPPFPPPFSSGYYPFDHYMHRDREEMNSNEKDSEETTKEENEKDENIDEKDENVDDKVEEYFPGDTTNDQQESPTPSDFQGGGPDGGGDSNQTER